MQLYLILISIILFLITVIVLALKGYLQKILSWINIQVNWVKGFFEEKQVDLTMKPSQKRLVSFMVVVTFLYTYVYTLLRKTDVIASKLSEIQFPDIPPTWAMLIGYIIGVDIYSNYQNNKSLNTYQNNNKG